MKIDIPIPSTSGTDTYTVSFNPTLTAYVTNQVYYVKFVNANTGAATLNVDSLGAKDIKKTGSTALASGDILANQILSLTYDGTNFQLIGDGGGSGGGISGLTTNELVYGNSATTIASLPVATYPNLTELSYVKGVTSAIQTQLDGKYFNMNFPMTALAAPADSTNYHINQGVSATATTDTARPFKFDAARTLKQIVLNIQQSTNGSNETVTVYLRNITAATEVSVLTFTSDFGASTGTSFVSAVLTESVNASDKYTWRITTPAWGTNPAQWVFAITASLI